MNGSSYNTLPWFHEQYGETLKCDVFSVDGDHSYEGCLTDLINAMKLMRMGGTVLADDISRK